MYSLYNYINSQHYTNYNTTKLKSVSLALALAFSPIYILISLACAIEVQHSNENCFTVLYLSLDKRMYVDKYQLCRIIIIINQMI